MSSDDEGWDKFCIHCGCSCGKDCGCRTPEGCKECSCDANGKAKK